MKIFSPFLRVLFLIVTILMLLSLVGARAEEDNLGTPLYGRSLNNSVANSKPEYQIPCNVNLNGNWKKVRDHWKYGDDQGLLDQLNNRGMRLHPSGNGAIDINDNPINVGESAQKRTYGICDDRQVISAAVGTVRSNKCISGGWGCFVRIEHSNKQASIYAHLARQSDLVVGQEYPAGTIVGTMGATGEAYGFVHLHFEFRQNVMGDRTDNWQFVLPTPPIPPCPAPAENMITFFKYPKATNGGCGDEGASALYEYDVSKIFNALEPKVINVPFEPKSIHFPTRSLNPTNSFGSDRSYIFRTLIPNQNDFVIDVSGESIYPGASIIQWGWHGNSNQKWGIDDMGGGDYQILSLHSGQCMAPGNSNPGASIIQTYCIGNDVLWKLENLDSNGNYRIRHKNSGLVLDVPGSSKDWGTQLILWHQNSGDNQKWHICEAAQIELKANGGSQLTIKQGIDNINPGTNSFTIQANQLCVTNSEQQNLLSNSINCVNNQPPNTPQPTTPQNGYGKEHYAPTLCWASGGDPEKNPLDFQVQIIGGTSTFSSVWLSRGCWRPSMLDYQYGGYQWRVRARDQDLALSDWSSPRTFSVLSPNKLPEINFQTANGNTSSLIFSRDTNWTFAGTASDPEGQIKRIEFRCTGDGCGNQTAHNGLANWSHTRSNLSGRNDIYFVVVDGVDQTTVSRHLDLRIDLAKPATSISLNSEANPARWPAWFTSDVQVQLSATDNGSGRAVSGIQQLNYRIDGGSWQTVNADSVSFTISTDGTHIIEYYAIDKVGNVEETKSTTFKNDKTPPSPPGGTLENSGVLDDQWQKDQNTPNFTWAESFDATSDLWGYQLYFGKDASGIGYQNFQVGTPREWMPQPGGVHTGSYYLRGRSRDIAGNWSAWTTMFIFRYDGTPPENPVNITHTEEITSTLWQRVTNTADFNWAIPHDEGSGIQGYYVYWGLDSTITTTQLITDNAFQDVDPLCGHTEACIGYLRLRGVDKVGNMATEWSTVFELRYDNAPPVVDFIINDGITETVQTQLFLKINASDQGSGVRAMRVSNDGKQWIPWEAYATKRLWMIPPISRQTWPVYVQVQDWVDLPSDVVSHTVRLDVNRKQSQSENYRLFDQYQPAGSGAYTSTTYTGRGSLGQSTDGMVVASNSFTLWSGYEAGSQAIPIIWPGHDDFNTINGMFSSGNAPVQMASASFSMLGTLGEWGLPNSTTITSGSFHHQPGSLAYQPTALSASTENPPGLEPEPLPIVTCQTPYISINQNASFTNQLHVTLTICAPQAVEMMLSNNADFTGSTWEPFSETREWVFTSVSQQVVPVYIYAAFKDANGKVDKAYFDDILYDPNIPTSEIMVGDSLANLNTNQLAQVSLDSERNQSLMIVDGVPFAKVAIESGISQFVPMLSQNDDGGVDILVNGYDDNSGVAHMQISASPAFTDTSWIDFTPLVSWMPPGEDGLKTVYVQLSDGAGNISSLSETSFIYDTNPPVGWVSFNQRVYPTDTLTATVFTSAVDGITWEAYDGEFETPPDSYAGIVSEMRLSFTSTLTSVPWQVYTDTLDIQLPGSDSGSIYVQYRDLAGNISEVYSDTYQIDVTPPIIKVEVSSGETLSRTLTIAAHDDLSGLAEIRLSNDPWDEEAATTIHYSESVAWIFNEDRIVWVQVSDGVGNWSNLYPAYAEESQNMIYNIYMPLVQR